MNPVVISANRSPSREPKNWRVFEEEMLTKHFGPVLSVNGEDGHSVLDAYKQHQDTVKYIRWYPDPELLMLEEYKGMLRQNEAIGDLPYITNSASGFINVQNKENAFKTWKENGVNCPDYFVYSDRLDFHEKREETPIPVPFLLRLNNSVAGKQTYVIRDEKDIEDVLLKLDNDYLSYTQHNSRIKTVKMCVQLVDCVDRSRNVNLSFRIHVAGDRVISGYGRVVDAGEWLAITAGKFKAENIENWVHYNKVCETIMTTFEDDICRAVQVLGLNHQGVDVIIDQTDNSLCFLEVQPTYATGYPQEGFCGYYKPFYNPSDPFLVRFLQQNQQELQQVIPRYCYNWLDKRNHFDLVYKSLKDHLDVRT